MREEREQARGAGAVETGIDGYSFLVSFKGTFLEGLEVVFIALTFGSNQTNVPVGRRCGAGGGARRGRRRCRRCVRHWRVSPRTT